VQPSLSEAVSCDFAAIHAQLGERRPMPSRLFRVVLAAIVLLAGCHGPRLSLENTEITSFDPVAKTLSWSTEVHNSTAGQSFLTCVRKKAHGKIGVHGWVTQSPDVGDPSRIGAGGATVFQAWEDLEPGQERSASFNNVMLQTTSLDGYQYLVIEAYTEKGFEQKESANDSCRRFYTTVVVPLF
jgi:hypothetical protein